MLTMVVWTGDKVDVITTSAQQAMTVIDYAVPVMNAFEQTDLAQKIERGIVHFVDDIPWLMKGLDELARIHPAVTGKSCLMMCNPIPQHS